MIAEDLGVLVPAVKKLLKKTGWPGMRVLLFAFDGNPHNEHLPYNYESQNEVVYTGTHDNETVAGYFAQKTQKELEFAYRYLEIYERRQIPDALIREAYRSSADIVIISLQDLLGLSNEARMNFPSTIGKNWWFLNRFPWRIIIVPIMRSLYILFMMEMGTGSEI
ncbi:4-alpha-glucanotransferase [Suilimivivens sp.]|uniref:4-alpha-glucanotransferase n=1 Tax=Suilimivivens sp. TaxID=2981669 RepID=UPI003079428B